MLLVLLVACVASAAYDNFPTKSVNLDNPGVPVVVFYHLYNLGIVKDPHPVHGIETLDGGFVVVGKGFDDAGDEEAFAVRIDAEGQFLWAWSSDHLGKDVANSVAQLSDSREDEIVIAGYRLIEGVAKRSLTKLFLSTGTEAWTITNFGDRSAEHGAWESVHLSQNNDALLLAGLHLKPNTEELAFKSYGNAPGGRAVIWRLPVTLLSENTDSSNADWIIDNFDPEIATCKAAKPAWNDSVIALLWGDGELYQATVALFDGQGELQWLKKIGKTHGEGTDVAQSIASESGFVVTGHGGQEGKGTLSGRLSLLNDRGDHEWSRSYTAGGKPQIIYNECWGLQSLPDGYVLACGTGIEYCKPRGAVLAVTIAIGLVSAFVTWIGSRNIQRKGCRNVCLHKKPSSRQRPEPNKPPDSSAAVDQEAMPSFCQQPCTKILLRVAAVLCAVVATVTLTLFVACQFPIEGDARRGAVPRRAGVWQSLVVRTDADGALLWQRVDQYREQGSPELGNKGWSEYSSASEHAILGANGSLLFVQDEQGGAGLMKLA